MGQSAPWGEKGAAELLAYMQPTLFPDTIFKIYLFFIEVQLAYQVVFISAVQKI